MPEPVVFLGPSLERRAALAILKADYRPPAGRDDITRAVREGARLIGLIDGVFFQGCSVGHKEILDALQAGVTVVGASSMGALRAAELDVYGMEGVGEIYRLYKEGILDSDDEVALVFDPETYLPLSEPLINIRCTIREAIRRGVVGKTDGDLILKAACSLYFPERTYDAVCEEAKESADPEAIQRFIDFTQISPVDMKRADAIAALTRLRELDECCRGT